MESIIWPNVGWVSTDSQGDLGDMAIIWIETKSSVTFIPSSLNTITLSHHYILSVWHWNLVNIYAFNKKGRRK